MTPRIRDRVLVLDGYGISLTVERGHLAIRDGAADERRERRLSRVQPDIDRIVVLADTGTITLDAIRWCTDIGITITQVDRHGQILLTAIPPGRNNSRLRRAQALAPDREAGLVATRTLLHAKLQGQAALTSRILEDPQRAERIVEIAGRLDNVQQLSAMRSLEAEAANIYFQAWEPKIHVRFARADRSRIPDHWAAFGGRRPTRRTSSFAAINPANAIINYLYALAEIETRRACIVIGLDPLLGILHTDRHARGGLVLDLLEPIRPNVDEWALRLLQDRTFTRNDFHETRQGTCRLLAPLTHDLATTMPLWAHHVAPHVEAFAHTIAADGPLPIRTATPLTQQRSRKASKAAAKASRIVKAPSKTCRECGITVSNRNKYCDECWTRIKPTTAAKHGFTQAQAALTQARNAGKDPTQSSQARSRRNTSVLATRRLDRAWDQTHPDGPADTGQFETQILPGLPSLRLSVLAEATGLSQAACSMIRSGKVTPHPRHWDVLAQLAQDDEARRSTIPGRRSVK